MHADLSLMGRDQLQDCNINRVCVELRIRHAQDPGSRIARIDVLL